MNPHPKYKIKQDIIQWIMNKNDKFVRRSFTKKQWDIMYKNILFKSSEVNRPGGYDNGLSENNSYIESMTDEFVEQLNQIL
jgi:hypothetical protein